MLNLICAEEDFKLIYDESTLSPQDRGFAGKINYFCISFPWSVFASCSKLAADVLNFPFVPLPSVNKVASRILPPETKEPFCTHHDVGSLGELYSFIEF